MRRAGVTGEDGRRGGGGRAAAGEPTLGAEGEEGCDKAEEERDRNFAGLRREPGAETGGPGEKGGGRAADLPLGSGENIAAKEAARGGAADRVIAKVDLVGQPLVIRDRLVQDHAAVEFEAERSSGGFGCTDEGVERRQRDAQGVTAAGHERDGFGGRAAEAPVVVGKSGGGAVDVVDDQKIGVTEGAGGNEGLGARRRATGKFQFESEVPREWREGAREANEREGDKGRYADEGREETAESAGRCRRGVTHGAGVGRSEKNPSTRVRSRE